MAVENRLKEYIEGLQITPYEFAKKTGVALNTVYALCNKPKQLPASTVMDKILKTYPTVTPNDLIAFIADKD